jgi:hypothetical protein
MIREVLLKENPDVTILHDNDNSALNKRLVPLQPCVNFVHSHVGMAGGMAALVYILTLHQMAQQGHAVVCVSNASRREWLGLARKSQKWLLGNGLPAEALETDDAIFNEWFHHAITWEKPELKSVTKGYITIGRMIPTKRHRIGLQATENLRIFCPPPGNDEQKTVYAKLVAKFGGERINATGVPDAELEAEISCSKALLVFAQESFGLTAVEANIHGVPVILSHRIDDHPIKEACGPSREHGSLHVIPHAEGINGIREFLATFEAPPDEQRQRILDATWGYYNPKASLRRLEALMDKTIEGWTSRQEKLKVEEEDNVFEYFS